MNLKEESKELHLTGDEALSHLANTPGAFGAYVRDYPGQRGVEETEWLDDWFQARIEKHFQDTLSDDDVIISPASPHPLDEVGHLTAAIKLRYVEASYFRGFRDSHGTINLNEDLVVVEGRNSTGKTSFAEALEWLFTGALSRREQGETGNPRELEQCITNQFCPEDTQPWVKATFTVDDGESSTDFTLHRVLVRDYGITSTATPESILYANGHQLTGEKERILLEQMFAGVAPILMQHTLRDFVHSEPRKRREYFERLLRLDELTEVIRRSVMTDANLSRFPGPSGNEPLQNWNALGSIIGARRLDGFWNQPTGNVESDSLSRTQYALKRAGREKFPELLGTLSEFEEMEIVLDTEQRRARQRSFPILEQLRPKDPQPEVIKLTEDIEATNTLRDNISSANQQFDSARLAAESVGSNNIHISRAFKILVDESIVIRDAGTQICPICDHRETETLTFDRINTIEGWNPIMQAQHLAKRHLKTEMEKLLHVVGLVLGELNRVLPRTPSESQWATALEGAGEDLTGVALSLRSLRDTIEEHLGPIASNGRTLVSQGVTASAVQDPGPFVEQCTAILSGLKRLADSSDEYKSVFSAVEGAVSREASDDPEYGQREVLLNCIQAAPAIAETLLWEQSKRNAQNDLKQIRQCLMDYRREFLEMKRTSFNDGIQTIWTALREDRYSSFKRLHIPEPRGRGFPVEFEIKATLDDRSEQHEVDALRVFSESQVNAIGLGAFVTRGKLLGHKILIFDDPVQSMDEDHFKSFASRVIPNLLDIGFQVIIFTHNDTFARDLSYFHYGREGYSTMSTRQSRREGIIVEEGSRRVSERLKLAERKAEEGLLSESWRYVRLAIERLYVVSYIKYGPPTFKPESWQEQTAQYMWSSGVESIFTNKVPGSGRTLQEILEMANAGGHDAPPRGETDLLTSTAAIRHLLRSLHLGD